MQISALRAFKESYSKPLWIVGLFSILPLFFALLWKNAVLYWVVVAVSYLLVSGYYMLFAHRNITNQQPVFPKLTWDLVKMGFKYIVFGICCAILFIPFMFIVYGGSLISPILGIILLTIFAIYFFFYVMVATGRFLEDYKLRIAFEVATNSQLLYRYWFQLLRIIFFEVGAIVILFIPLFLVYLLGFILVWVSGYFLFTLAYLMAVVQCYLSFVTLHIFTQGFGELMPAEIKQTPAKTTKKVSVKSTKKKK